MGARISFVLVSVLAACGGGGSDNNDGMNMIDSPPASIALVDPCPGTVDATVTAIPAGATSFTPAATTITQGQVVKFEVGSAHDVAPLPTMSDPALVVPSGGTRCFRFTLPGTFRFKCTPHGFVGMVTVN